MCDSSLVLIVHCLDLAGPEESLFLLRSTRKRTYLSQGVGRLGNLT